MKYKEAASEREGIAFRIGGTEMMHMRSILSEIPFCHPLTDAKEISGLYGECHI